MTDDKLKAIVEALLFASGDPLSIKSIAEITEQSEIRIEDVLHLLADELASDSRGLMLRQINSSYALTTKMELTDFVARLFRPEHRPALTNAAYEALACIAYNQPCTRAQVEHVRGVNSDSLISRLLERGLIEETGQLDVPGKPSLFSVTELFLREFGLQSTSELPAQEMIMYDSLQQLAGEQ